jgi:hypothetical protein
MKNITVDGAETRYWDFDRQTTVEVERDGAKVQTVIVEPGYVKKPVSVEVAQVESVEDVFALTDNKESRLIELVNKALLAEAEETAGEVPESAFSVAMVQAADRALKVNPPFSTIKKSKDRREAIMRFIGATAEMRAAFNVAFAAFRKAKATAEADDE